MTVLRASAVIDAPTGAVVRALHRADVWTRTARAMDARADIAPALTDPRAPLAAGTRIRVRPAADRRTDSWLPPRTLLLEVGLEVGRDGAALPTLNLLAGPLTVLRVSVAVEPTQEGTEVTVRCEISASSPLAARAARRRALEAARVLLGITVLAAREPLVVVAAALTRGGRVLAARRTRPPEQAGQWEFPGGKVRPGETEPAALARELLEELGVVAAVGARVGDDVDLGDNAVLRCFHAEVDTADVRPNEHDAVRWLPPEELADVTWLPADAALLPAVRNLLSGT